MADAAATRRPDGTYPDSMPEEQAFNNVYLFYRICTRTTTGVAATLHSAASLSRAIATIAWT